MFTRHHMRKYRTLLNGKQPKAIVVRKKERGGGWKKYNGSSFNYINSLFDSLEGNLENV